MRVRVDEPWSYHAILGVNSEVNLTREVFANMDNLIAFNHNAAVSQDAMLAVLKPDNRPSLNLCSIRQRSLSPHATIIPAPVAMIFDRHRTVAEG